MMRSHFLLFFIVISLGFSVPALAADTVSPEEHQAIKASVLDPTPANYTIDVKKFANMGVDEDAPTFAVYITSRLPKDCGDFRDLELAYAKPDKYKRQFDLSKHQKVIEALDQYGCVVMRNIPSKK